MRVGGSGGNYRERSAYIQEAHRPCHDLWTVVSLGTFIESECCTSVESVMRAVRRSDPSQPVLVSYLGRPAHISEPLASDGSWDGN